MRVLIALGGNALLRRGEPADFATQHGHIAEAVEGLAAVGRRHGLILTHGNGPQVGLLALQGQAYTDVSPYPLDVLGAETEGMIGYMLELALRNTLPDHDIATVLTQVLVDGSDPAFAAPSKPVGPTYSRDEARALAAEHGWSVGPDGDRFRRLVASPEPVAVVEVATLRILIDAGTIVVCAGGGGIPVTVDDAGSMRGVEAVIDKDLTAALLARRLGADLLVMLTDVAAVERGWGTPEAQPIRKCTPDDLAGLSLAAGSMGPKVEAARRFVEASGGRAAIGALEDVERIVAGSAGTQIVLQAPVDGAAGVASDGSAEHRVDKGLLRR